MNRIFLLVLIVFVISCKQKSEDEKKAEPLTSTPKSPSITSSDLPAMQIRLTDGNIVDLKTVKGKTMLVLFQPDCDHCQHEAQEMKASFDKFKDEAMYFISSSPVEDMIKFSKDYGFADQKNVYFGWTTTENILNTFGPIQAPSVYIYSETGQLVQKFNGQTPVENIIKYL